MVTGSFRSVHRFRLAFPVASLTFSRSASQTIRKQLLPGIPKEIGSGGTDLQLAFLSHVKRKIAARDQIHVIYTLKIACQRSGDAYIGFLTSWVSKYMMDTAFQWMVFYFPMREIKTIH